MELSIYNKELYIVVGIVFVVGVSVIGNRFRHLHNLDDNQLSNLKDIYAKKHTKRLERKTRAMLSITSVDNKELQQLIDKGTITLDKLILNKHSQSLKKQTLNVVIKNVGNANVYGFSYVYCLDRGPKTVACAKRELNSIDTLSKGEKIVWQIDIYDVSPTLNLFINIVCENEIGYSRIFGKKFCYNEGKRCFEGSKSPRLVLE